MAFSPVCQAAKQLISWNNTQIFQHFYQLFVETWWLLLLPESLYVDDGVFISQDKVDIRYTHHNQLVYPEFSYTAPKTQFKFPDPITANHSLPIYSRYLYCRRAVYAPGNTM